MGIFYAKDGGWAYGVPKKRKKIIRKKEKKKRDFDVIIWIILNR